MKLDIFPSVYEPREDSFLLANAVQQFAQGNVLEIGTGSGIQVITAAKLKKVTRVLAVDISLVALDCAKKNAKLNDVEKKIEFKQSNLFENVTGKFDTIIFNPPYVPVEKDEVLDEQSAAWHGGTDGRSLLDPFLEQFSSYLSKKGTLLLLQSSLNNLPKTKRVLAKLGFKVEQVSEQSFFFEKIYVLKAVRIVK